MQLMKPDVWFGELNSLTSSSTPLTALLSISSTVHAYGKPTQIDNPNIHPKRLRREIGNIAHIIAQVTNRSNPMEYRRPNRCPAHEIRINRGLILCHDIKDRVIEQRNQPRDTHDSQRLCTKDTKHHGRQRGREQALVDAEEAVCSTVHV